MPEGPVRVTGTLLAVLDALLEADNHELHGWAIMKTTGKSGPTIYKILERLAESKWVTFRWDTDTEPGKPRRRYYQLTGEGVSSARQLLAQRRTKTAPAGRARLAFGECGA
ncbi:PadR family transcriptional regulator [Micromonospora sp. NPDC003816]|uniref:PadR family transcriptional regulator n=1 Tax=Micromonospora sp. NPDC003816 TaxID=3364224 RepID=UPI0036BAA5B0